ncbi:MAG: hypothetical protein LBD45_00170 [Bacteroidales bacterium]|jgi:hypothetical protein|nr:hypothetical protein [Bacteroidales bacterium]
MKLIFILSLFITHVSAGEIQLNRIGGKSAVTAGISWGAPFAKGEVNVAQTFSLQTADRKELPVQSFPLAYWPDGSVKWMGFAATVPGDDRFFLNVEKSSLTGKINVIDNPDFIRIENGKFSCEVNKKGQAFIRNICIDNKIISENGRLVASLEHRIDGNGFSYENFQSSINNVEVEDAGNVRAVVKISGIYRSDESAREFLPFTVRLYFYSETENFRLVHSFVFDGNQEKDFIKSLGVSFDIPFREASHNRHIRFSGEDGGLWSEPVKPLVTRSPFVYRNERRLLEKQMSGERLPEITAVDSSAYRVYGNLPDWNDYKLTQLAADGFQVKKRTNVHSSWLFANAGRRASGMVMVGDVSGALGVSLKDFWQSFPASLEVNNARTDRANMKIWLWSPDGEAMDLRHYDVSAHDLDATYEDVQPGLSTPYGVARTSELTVFVLDTLPSKAAAVELASFGTKTQLLVCTPTYLHDKQAFGAWSLPDKTTNTNQWIENQLDNAFSFYQRAVDEHYWYGFWNYGDVMHTYDVSRHVWRYDVGGYAWANTELAPNNWLWYSFLRTGREDIFRMAEAMTRHTAEVDCYHAGDMKGLGSRHNVSHWGDGAKEVRIAQAAWKRFYYYLTADERCGDLMRESLEAEKALMFYEPLRIAQPREKFPYSAPTRLRWGPDWLALAGNWMTEWERTGNTFYRDKILAGMNSLISLPDNLFTGTGGLGYNPATGEMSYDGKPDVTNKNHLATIMGGYEILTELFDMIDHKPFRELFTEYCRYYSMPENDSTRTSNTKNWGNIQFRNPRLTAFAAKELNDENLASRAWNEFLFFPQRPQRISTQTNRTVIAQEGNVQPDIYSSYRVSPPETLNPVHENPFISTNGVAQWGLNAIIMLELIGDKLPDTRKDENEKLFHQAESKPWKLLFEDNMQGDWRKNWFLDGEKAELKNTTNGLIFRAGTTPANDASHSVLWTKKTFTGDLRVEFDFVKRDTATKFVNILYLFAEGSGVGAYKKDLFAWKDLRKIPAMKIYYEHINALHISFAAYENDNSDLSQDYVRARRYLPERGKGLEKTELLPDYSQTGLFLTNTKYHITLIRSHNDIFMKVQGAGKEKLFTWKMNAGNLSSGRTGLRIMGGRVSEFSNFNILGVEN